MYCMHYALQITGILQGYIYVMYVLQVSCVLQEAFIGEDHMVPPVSGRFSCCYCSHGSWYYRVQVWIYKSLALYYI